MGQNKQPPLAVSPTEPPSGPPLAPTTDSAPYSTSGYADSLDDSNHLISPSGLYKQDQDTLYSQLNSSSVPERISREYILYHFISIQIIIKMQFSKLIISAVAFVGLTAAQENASNGSSSSNGAVGGANQALSAGVMGAAAAGALAFLF